MALAGHALLALWNDIAPEREAEYDRWHTREHVPERVAVNGFLGARRYVDRNRSAHRYFTLYEVGDEAVFEHREYRDLLAHPTPWSASMRPDFRNVVRAIVRTQVSSGDGVGAALGVLGYVDADAPGASGAIDADAPWAPRAVDALMDQPGVVACHAGTRVNEAPAPAWAAASPPVRAFDRLILVEALDRSTAAQALARLRTMARLDRLPADCANAVYDLAFVFPGHDPAERQRHRRASWT